MSSTNNSEAVVPPAAPVISAQEERELTKLLALMAQRKVVPVIGPELLSVAWQGDPAARLYDLWGQAIARQYNEESALKPGETPLLYQIANHLSVKLPVGDLECDIDDVIRKGQWPLPESLRQLAEIDAFPLYLTTTIDHLMEAALLEVRGAGQAPLQIAFNRGGNKLTCDLPLDFLRDSQRGRQGPPTVFHLFGATCPDPDGFAATEDDLIDFSWALIDQSYSPTHLYDYLRGKTILLMGCDFPDWLERFFIHALTRNRDSDIKVTFVSRARSGGLQDFLTRRRASQLTPLSPVEFVAELHRRWRQRAPDPQAASFKGGAVFISYARDDRESAMAIRRQLEVAGLDTWMDESGIEPGDEYQEVIQQNIKKASFFVTVISRHLDLEGSDRLGRYVFREWRWAVRENEQRVEAEGFLQPIAVDDTRPDAAFILPAFREIHWTQLRDGSLEPAFIARIKEGIQRHRDRIRGSNP